jgi:hypothetical protein
MTRATSYAAPQKGAAGLLGDMNPAFTLSRAVETSGGIAFGVVVSRGTDRNKQCVVGGAVPLGVTCRTQDTESIAESYLQYETAKICHCGFVYLTLIDSANAGSALNYNTTTGLCGAGAPGGGELALPGELMEDSTAGTPALCWINIHAAVDYETRLAAAELAVGTTLPAVDAALQALFTGMGTGVGSSLCVVKISDLDMKTDESEKTAALPGTAGSTFAPIGYILKCVTGSGSPDGDGTVNIGITTGGAEIVSAGVCTGITDVGKTRFAPLAANVTEIAGNATIYANVESPDGDAGTCVYDVYLIGYQVGA